MKESCIPTLHLLGLAYICKPHTFDEIQHVSAYCATIIMHAYVAQFANAAWISIRHARLAYRKALSRAMQTALSLQCSGSQTKGLS